MSFKNSFIALMVAGLVTGCGGSGGNQNLPPTVSVNSTSVVEGGDVSLSASASDSDGMIVSYSWTQTSGTSVTLSGADTNIISFKAPTVTEDEVLTFVVTVTDDDGATANANATVTVTANMLNFKLEGLVTDGPIANANLIFTIGDQEFSATADENGAYSADISVDDSMTDAILIATATGPEGFSEIKLKSYIGSVDSLILASEDDGVVSKDEVFGVNVTNVTTATSILLERADEDGVVASSEEYEAALKSYDPSLVLPYATAIKLVIDYSSDNPELSLPEGVFDTISLISSEEKAAEYIVNASLMATQTYEQAENDILSDDEIISNGSTEISVADTYYFKGSDGFRVGGRFTLNEDSTGKWIDISYASDFTWVTADTGINIVFPGDGIYTGIYVNESGEQEEHYLTGIELKWITQTETTDLLKLSKTSTTIFPNGGHENGVVTENLVERVIKSRGTVNASQVFSVGNKYSVATVLDSKNIDVLGFSGGTQELSNTIVELTNDNNLVVQKVEFASNGEYSYSPTEFTWEITDSGVLSVNNGSFEVTVLEENNGLSPYTNILDTFEDENNQPVSRSDADNTFLKDQSLVWNDSNITGIYNLPWSYFAPLRHFWVEVNADGSALTVSTGDYNNNGTLEPAEGEITVMHGMWALQEDGRLNIRRYWYNEKLARKSGYCIPTTYNPSYENECVLYHERTWDLHQIKANEYQMNHMHRFYYDAWALYEEPAVTEHVLYSAYTDNRSWLKVDERPVNIDDALSVTAVSAKNPGVSESKKAKDVSAEIIKKEIELESRFLEY